MTGALALSRTAWPALLDRPWVLVPVGSTEQHGPHLPVGTDTTIAVAVATALAAELDGCLLAPALAFGSSGEHQGLPGVLSIGNAVLHAALVELVRSASLWAGRVTFVNGHGGNAPVLGAAVAQLRNEGHDVSWVPCAVAGADAHAGRTETSLMLHLEPAEVRIGAAEPGVVVPISDLYARLASEGVAAVSPNGVLGDPAGASAEEGAALLDKMVGNAFDRLAAAAMTGGGH